MRSTAVACLQMPQLTLGLSQLLPQHQHHLAPNRKWTPQHAIFAKRRDSFFLFFYLKKGAPRFELGTYRSAVDCSTTELYTRNHGHKGRWAVYIPCWSPPPHHRAGDLAEE